MTRRATSNLAACVAAAMIASACGADAGSATRGSPPSGLTYPSTLATYVVGTPITPNGATPGGWDGAC